MYFIKKMLSVVILPAVWILGAVLFVLSLATNLVSAGLAAIVWIMCCLTTPAPDVESSKTTLIKQLID